MKKRIVLMLAGLLLCSALAGCMAQTATGMQLTPHELSEDETELLALADVDLSQTAFALYEYQTDDSLHAISFSRYILNDMLEWEQDEAYQAARFDETQLGPNGLISLIEEENKSFAVNIRADGAGYHYNAPELPDGLPEIRARGFGSQSEAAEIVYGEEIPLLVRTFRADDSVYVYSANNFYDTARFEGDLFTEAYTVTFSDEMPEEGSPIT